MALIKCPECGKDVSDQAVACPNCGYPIANKIKQAEDELDPDKNPAARVYTAKSFEYVCNKCRMGVDSAYDYTGHKCISNDCNCDGKFVNTFKTYEEWMELFDEKYPERRPKRNHPDDVKGYEIDDFAGDTFLADADTVDEDLVIERKSNRTKRLEAEDQAFKRAPKCPKCGSRNFTQERRGFSVGKAVAAGAVTGFVDVAAVAGLAGSNQIVNVCSVCGHRWK